jgi:glutamyl-tRNA reductase
LVIIGLNFRTASLEVRERFWISDVRRYEAFHQLVRSEGIDEAVVLSTPYRTEFILWASDASFAANSVLRLLTREYNLKLCEWSNFYRLLDEAALTHLFRLTSALDTVAMGDTGVLSYVTAAWDQAEKAGTLGRFLNGVFESSLAISRRVLNETAAGAPSVSVASAVIDLCSNVLPSLEGNACCCLGLARWAKWRQALFLAPEPSRCRLQIATSSALTRSPRNSAESAFHSNNAGRQWRNATFSSVARRVRTRLCYANTSLA